MSTATSAATRGRIEGATAHRVVVWASLAALAADVAWMTLIGAIIPPLALFAVLTVALVLAARRWQRGAVIGLGLLALVAISGGSGFLVADLAHPSDSFAFLWAVISGGGRVVALVAAVLALIHLDQAARRLATVSLAVLAVAVVGSLTARFTVSSDARQDGDVEVVAEAVTFPEHIVVPAGGTVLVDNRDPVRHTFTVEGTDLDVLVEPGVQRRIEIDVSPGTYTLVCTVPGHESMTGTLEVG